MGNHPYSDLPDYAFWRRAVANVPGDALDPVVDVPFHISPRDRVATAGSCFAQHIGRYLSAAGCAYLVTEPAHPLASANAVRLTNYGMFTARYGNVYTARQLRQLFQRVYGRFTPKEDLWRGAGAACIDPFRPNIQPGGFNSEREFVIDREHHFRAVREAFETLDVFVFTLGLTEAWHSREDGAVFPVCPGVSGGSFSPRQHEFINFSVTDVVTDMQAFIGDLRRVNPKSKIILTVSPVPLVATAEQRHVLVSTTYSKSVLRVAAETLSRTLDSVSYFPSYEVVMASGWSYFAADRRSITEDGVAHVMRLFGQHYVRGGGLREAMSSLWPGAARHKMPDAQEAVQAAFEVMCDEEALDAIAAERAPAVLPAADS
jgi:hypothetical protein